MLLIHTPTAHMFTFACQHDRRIDFVGWGLCRGLCRTLCRTRCRTLCRGVIFIHSHFSELKVVSTPIDDNKDIPSMCSTTAISDNRVAFNPFGTTLRSPRPVVWDPSIVVPSSMIANIDSGTIQPASTAVPSVVKSHMVKQVRRSEIHTPPRIGVVASVGDRASTPMGVCITVDSSSTRTPATGATLSCRPALTRQDCV